jgi:hypothetical protein
VVAGSIRTWDAAAGVVDHVAGGVDADVDAGPQDDSTVGRGEGEIALRYGNFRGSLTIPDQDPALRITDGDSVAGDQDGAAAGERVRALGDDATGGDRRLGVVRDEGLGLIGLVHDVSWLPR